MQDTRPYATARTTRPRAIRQDLCFVVSALLMLAVAMAALTGLSSDEAEFFGLGDDLHGVAGWAVVVLAALHVLLHGSHMVRYARRRLRQFLGVGGVIEAGTDSGSEESRRRRLDETGAN
jgi:hypothetical protein